MKRIVSFGAWTGQAAVLKWLVTLPNCMITALVTTTDNGWSSALIRSSLDIPSPGDVRNVINAVNTNHDILSQLLNYRFSEGELTGTHLGNLIVGALSRICNGYEAGIQALNTLLDLPARVLPISDHPAQICAELDDGTCIEGEWQIIKRAQKDVPIKKYFLNRPSPAVKDGIDAIHNADMIVICPWVLGTWVISTLLFSGVQEAIQQSSAPIIYIANAMTYPSQTDGYTLSNHVTQLEYYLWRSLHTILANIWLPPEHILWEYKRIWSFPITIDHDKLVTYNLIQENLLIDYTVEQQAPELVRAASSTQHVWAHRIRHDSTKIASIISKLLENNCIF